MDEAKKPRTTTTTRKAPSSARRLDGSILNGGQQRRSIRDMELCQLENEIKKAYVLKGLHAQLAEQEADRMAAEIQARIADEVARCRTDAANEEHDRQQESKRQRIMNELKAALKRQVDEKREERDLLVEEERRERKILTEVDRVREENEELEKAQKKELLAEQQLLQSLVQREIREIDRQKLQELEDMESVKNELYAEELSERTDKLKKLRADAQRKREEAIVKVAKILLELQSEMTERRRVLSDLMIEEVKFDAELEAREAALRRRQKMKDVAAGLQEQIRFEEECKRRFMEREKQFAETIMAKVMESEKMDRLTAEEKRRRRLQYREELERLMKEREQARADELARLSIALEEERLVEEAELEEARKQRMLLLERHIDNIADFMSRKSLYDEERSVIEMMNSRQKKK